MALLDKVIADVIADNKKHIVGVDGYTVDMAREDALRIIKKWVDVDGFYKFSKNHGVLVDNSGEEFALEFMSAYNDVFGLTY
jgi:hypothetical protein